MPLLRLCGTDEALHGPLQSRRLNKQLPARMAELYEVPISEHDDLPQWVFAAAEAAEPKSHVRPERARDVYLHVESVQLETDASDDYVFVYGMFYEAVYQKITSTQI